MWRAELTRKFIAGEGLDVELLRKLRKYARDFKNGDALPAYPNPIDHSFKRGPRGSYKRKKQPTLRLVEENGLWIFKPIEIAGTACPPTPPVERGPAVTPRRSSKQRTTLDEPV